MVSHVMADLYGGKDSKYCTLYEVISDTVVYLTFHNQ